MSLLKPTILSPASKADTDIHDTRLRVLVAIASFGNRNIECLRRIISNYFSMRFALDVVVVSEAPKELDRRVNVVVGLPSSNPWSLPFAHKRVFLERMDQYDLFIYSEDDMEVSEDGILAFRTLSSQLRDDEIAGYLRYEVDEVGNRFLPDFHGSFRWKVSSVRRRGEHIIAEFSNEHSAFYVLNRQQLRQAIKSGGFLREPYEGRYDMLCTAATDPYTSCGFKKVLNVSSINSCLVHHVTNRYAGRTGLAFDDFEDQLSTLRAIAEGGHPAHEDVFDVGEQGRESSVDHYSPPWEDLQELLPEDTSTILTLGCGSGKMERALVNGGFRVTSIPVDSVMAASAAKEGVEIVHANRVGEAWLQLAGRRFDAIIHHEIAADQARCSGPLLSNGGILLVKAPNSAYLPDRFRGWFAAIPAASKRRRVQRPVGFEEIDGFLQRNGFVLERVIWSAGRKPGPASGAFGNVTRLLRWMAQQWHWTKWMIVRLPFGNLLARAWTARWRKVHQGEGAGTA